MRHHRIDMQYSDCTRKGKLDFVLIEHLTDPSRLMFQNGTRCRVIRIEASLVEWTHSFGASLIDKKVAIYTDIILELFIYHKDFSHSSKRSRTSYSLKLSRILCIFEHCPLDSSREKIMNGRHWLLHNKPAKRFIDREKFHQNRF